MRLNIWEEGEKSTKQMTSVKWDFKWEGCINSNVLSFCLYQSITTEQDIKKKNHFQLSKGQQVENSAVGSMVTAWQ